MDGGSSHSSFPGSASQDFASNGSSAHHFQIDAPTSRTEGENFRLPPPIGRRQHMNVSEQSAGGQMNFIPKVRHDVERYRPTMVAARATDGETHVPLGIGFSHTFFEKGANLLGKIVHLARVSPFLCSKDAAPQQHPNSFLRSGG